MKLNQPINYTQKNKRQTKGYIVKHMNMQNQAKWKMARVLTDRQWNLKLLQKKNRVWVDWSSYEKPIGTESADDLAQEILGVLTEGSNVPEWKLLVFVYKPKTPNIAYDEHPLVAVTDVFSWGFRDWIIIGVKWGNIHPRIVGGLYKVDEMELEI